VVNVGDGSVQEFGFFRRRWNPASAGYIHPHYCGNIYSLFRLYKRLNAVSPKIREMRGLRFYPRYKKSGTVWKFFYRFGHSKHSCFACSRTLLTTNCFFETYTIYHAQVLASGSIKTQSDLFNSLLLFKL